MLTSSPTAVAAWRGPGSLPWANSEPMTAPPTATRATSATTGHWRRAKSRTCRGTAGAGAELTTVFDASPAEGGGNASHGFNAAGGSEGAAADEAAAREAGLADGDPEAGLAGSDGVVGLAGARAGPGWGGAGAEAGFDGAGGGAGLAGAD